MRASSRRVRRVVWASVGAYASLSLYAAATDHGLAALATDLLFGGAMVGFGVLLLARTTAPYFRAAGGLLTFGGLLELVGAFAATPDGVADALVVAGLVVYLYERSIRPARDARDDPLAPENV